VLVASLVIRWATAIPTISNLDLLLIIQSTSAKTRNETRDVLEATASRRVRRLQALVLYGQGCYDAQIRRVKQNAGL